MRVARSWLREPQLFLDSNENWDQLSKNQGAGGPEARIKEGHAAAASETIVSLAPVLKLRLRNCLRSLKKQKAPPPTGSSSTILNPQGRGASEPRLPPQSLAARAVGVLLLPDRHTVVSGE